MMNTGSEKKGTIYHFYVKMGTIVRIPVHNIYKNSLKTQYVIYLHAHYYLSNRIENVKENKTFISTAT